MLWIISQAPTVITLQYFYRLLLSNRAALTDPGLSKNSCSLAVSARRYPTPPGEAPGFCFLMVKQGLFREHYGHEHKVKERLRDAAVKGGRKEEGGWRAGFRDSKNRCSLDWPCLPTLVQCTCFPLLLCHPSLLRPFLLPLTCTS